MALFIFPKSFPQLELEDKKLKAEERSNITRTWDREEG